ncbi:MAG: hypothetical protein AB1591_08375 [Pseudomonadota bacterium]
MKKTVAAGLLLALLGCSKLTLENYDKIETGMSFEEVTRLIGVPAKCDDVMGMRSCSWGDETRSVNVTFAADQVLLFSSDNLD